MKTGVIEILRKISVLFIPYLIIVIACLIIKSVFSRQEIFFFINGYHNAFTDKIFIVATAMGDGITIICLSLIIALFNYRKALLLFSSYLVTALVAQILKFSFDEPRPKLYFKDKLSEIYFVKGVVIASVHSFPSGHTVSAFSAAVVLTYLSKNKYWGLCFLILAVLVGYSRMYLAEHFFEDVLAGSVIGIVVTVLWLNWLDKLALLQKSNWHRGLLKK